ncbi:MAG: 2-hydroxyacid dehydrogenase, partial [Acidimicrobiales bacterium]
CLERECDTARLYQAADRAAFLQEVGPGVRALIGGGAVDAALIAALPRLELIASTAVGYENIDVETAVTRGIIVTNTPEVLNDAVADLAFALILGIERRVVAADAFVRSGKWPQGGFPYTRHLSDLTLGILGLGRIGLVIARRAEAFGMKVAYHNRHPRMDVPYTYHLDVLSLAQASDVLLCTVPGGAETRHLVDEEVLRALGPEGTLVNIARGSVVDEAALVRCLQQGALGAAALDVFEHEPLPADHPFWGMDQVIVSPHMSGDEEGWMQALGQQFAEEFHRWQEGEPLQHVVKEAAACPAGGGSGRGPDDRE